MTSPHVVETLNDSMDKALTRSVAQGEFLVVVSSIIALFTDDFAGSNPAYYARALLES